MRPDEFARADSSPEVSMEELNSLFVQAKTNKNTIKNILADLKSLELTKKSDKEWLKRQLQNIIKTENKSVARTLRGLMTREWKQHLLNNTRI
jgi:hypothetical protein